MKHFRQIPPGILATFVSIGIVFGSLMTAFVEVGSDFGLLYGITPQAVKPLSPSWTPKPGTQSADLLTATPLPSLLPMATSTSACVHPAGWTTVITVQPGDTLEALAEAYHTPVQRLKKANCLPSTIIYPGQFLYVPDLIPTPTAFVCVPQYGWVRYTVQPGDSLYSISLRFRTTVIALQQANCLGTSTLIWVGQPLYVPYVATSTPWPTLTSTASSPPVFTPTSIPTSTASPEYTATPSLSPTASDTPVSTLTPTLVTLTPLPSSTPTPDLPSATPEPTSTATVTTTPVITFTPTATGTDTPLPTVTVVPKATFTPTPISSATSLPLATLTETPTATLPDSTTTQTSTPTVPAY